MHEGPFRIVHLIGELGFGGSERQLLLLARHLRSGFEHHVVVFNPSFDSYHQALAAAGATVVTAPAGTLRRVAFVCGLLARLRADVVHSWSTHDNAYAAVSGHLARTPLRLGSLRGSLHTPALRGLGRVARRLCLHGVDRMVVNASCLRAELIAAALPATRVLVVPNLVELPASQGRGDLRAELGIPAAAPLVGMVANLRPIKDHVSFVAAVTRALNALPEAHAVIAGQPLRGEEAYARAVGDAVRSSAAAARIHLLGARADGPTLIAQLDLLCLTSLSEGTPNTVLEALAHGRPVVATAVGGVPDLVQDGESGFLVSPHLDHPDRIAALARHLERLLGDAHLRACLGRAGADWVRRHHAPAAAGQAMAGVYHLARRRERAAA